MKRKAILRMLLVFGLAVSLLSNLCMMLWGGQGAFTQLERGALMVLGLIALALVMRG